MSEIHQVTEVFTPSTPAKKAFIERVSVQNKLSIAITTPGKQIVIFGHSGVGKTSLINHKLHQTYENHITSRCMKGMKFDQILLDAFSKIEKYYIAEISQTKSKKLSISTEAADLFNQIKLQSSIEIKSDEHTRFAPIIPPQLTGPNLGRLLGELKACWVLEDFHKIENNEKIYLSQLMKVFMDLAEEYPDVKIIAIGAVDTARQVVDYDPEMKGRVFELPVPLMTDAEIKEIISKGANLLNLKFSEELQSEIVQHSAGMASVCHDLCLHLCTEAGIFETAFSTVEFSKIDWKNALLSYLSASSDKIQSSFEKALKQNRRGKFNHEKIIIECLCDFQHGKAARLELEAKILRIHPNYPKTSLKGRLDKLCFPERGAILKYSPNSGTYCFSDPIYHAYALAHRRAIFESKDNSPIPPEHEAFLNAIRKILKMPNVKITLEDH